MLSHRTAIDPKFWQGKVVWITGASSGIGEAMARIAADHGAKAVVVSARRLDKLQALAEQDSSIKPLALDVTDHQATADAIKQIVDDYGTIDVAVLNAGRGASCLADEFDVQMSSEMFDLNVLSYINATKLVSEHLNISSI
jgi:NADP-dependent 3-hydroxy acid dehydrogenase YdfG